MTAYKPWLLAFSLVALAAGSAYANDTTKSKHSSATGASSAAASQSLDFSKADKNHDGKLSRSEWASAMKQSNKSAASGGSSASAGSKADFSKLDKNHDGSISRQEFDAGMKGSSASSSAASGSSKKAK